MATYIQSTGIISPQNNELLQGFPDELVEYDNNHLRSLMPATKEFIDPRVSRRMSSIIKKTLVAAKICIAEAGGENPDAIISGTGLGCMEDTEKFLRLMLDNDEQFLQPTAFIQSTHNTVSSQIAIALKCHGYNSTYVNRGFSFESTIIDAMMLLDDKQAKKILIGCYDEMTPSYHRLLSRVGYWKEKDIKNTKLFENTSSSGTIAGEGCAYFMLSGTKDSRSSAELVDTETIYKPSNPVELAEKVKSFLATNNIATVDIDLLVSGVNADKNLMPNFEAVHNLFSTDILAYKHFSGDYYTASSIGLWCAVKIFQNTPVPDYMYYKKKCDAKEVNNILLFNNYRNSNFSLILLKKC